MSKDMQFDFRREDIARATRVILLGFVLLAVLLGDSRSIYTVQPNELAVVLRFGKYVATTDPGLHFCIPFVDEVLTADTRERTVRMPFGVADDRPVARVSEDDVLMLTGDLNAAAVEWTLQWRVADPRQYLFTFHDPYIEQDQYLQAIISIVGRTVMNRLVGNYSIDEVLTGKRNEVREAALAATQDMLDKYECGIRITDLQLQRVTPPEQVKASFAAVNEAVQTRDKLENEANKERNTVLPAARAERDKAIREAEGYAARRRS